MTTPLAPSHEHQLVLSMLTASPSKFPNRISFLFGFRSLGIATLALFAAALLLPAIFNGYPLIFWDSATYILDGFGTGEPHEKALPYAAFVALTSLGLSLWPVILCQALLVIYALYCVCLALDQSPLGRPALFGMLALIGLTPLPWTTSHVMPDIFAAILVLCVFVLALKPDPLPRRHRIGLAFLLVLSASVHNSHLLLLALLLVAMWAVYAVRSWRHGWAAVPLRRLAECAGLWVCAVGLILGMNLVRTGEFYLFKQGHIYQINRLVEDGLLQRLLADHCGSHDYLLCPYQPLPTGRMQFMIDPDSPLYRAQAWRPAARAQMVEMISDTIRLYPREYLRASLSQVWEQVGSYDLVRYVFRMMPEPKRNPDHFGTQTADVLDTLRTHFPAEYPAFSASRQQRGAMPGAALADWLADLHADVVWCSGCIAVTLAFCGPLGQQRELRRLLGFIATALLFNAAICAVLSHSEFRYQARVVWLLPLCAGLAWTKARQANWAAPGNARLDTSAP